VSRAVTAAPGDQAVSSNALAKDQDVPKTADYNSAMPRPEARKLRLLAFAPSFGVRLCSAGIVASSQE
jgi:hypothetical protein